MTRTLRISFTVAAAMALVQCSSKSGGGSTPSEAGATMATGPSCAGGGSGVDDCGSTKETCCTSLAVPGGAFYRSYDGISTNGATRSYPATVDDLSVDKYEVTVGRFRAFVAAASNGWTPSAGAGKHSPALRDESSGATETGWDASWDGDLATSAADWSTNLACDPSLATWTGSATTHENLPINCVDFYEAYAFCIWDGGFLPSEAEWNYTAAGGDQQRVYPWSAAYPPGSTTLDCSLADYSSCSALAANDVGSESPGGDARWGHVDMAGNVFEWTLDGYGDTYASTSCDHCADLATTPFKVIRGGGFSGSPACLLNSLRESSAPDGRSTAIGVRCARPAP